MHGEKRFLPLQMPRLVGGAEMREKNDAHSLQAFIGEDASGTFLARSYNRVCRFGGYWTRVVRKETFPGKVRETVGRGSRQKQQIQ